MKLIIIITIFLIICFMIPTRNIKKLNEDKKNKYLSMGYNYINILSANYKGGIKNISSNNQIITIDLLQEGLNFKTSTIEKIILFDNIQDISLQSQQHIQNQVSLGKLVVFGVLAFGMKGKSNTINDEYIVLNVTDEDGEYNVIIQARESVKNQELYNTLSTHRDKYRSLSKESI